MTSLAVGAVAGAIASSAYRRTSSFSSPSKSSKNETPAQPRGNGKNVGILAMEIYTPRTYISQSKLEEHSG
eukprot:scaffold12291_cov61-Skeletonema_dohrnii-CCMP3373.AAC.1